MSILLNNTIFFGFPYYMLWVEFPSVAHALHPLNWGAEHEVFSLHQDLAYFAGQS